MSKMHTKCDDFLHFAGGVIADDLLIKPHSDEEQIIGWGEGQP